MADELDRVSEARRVWQRLIAKPWVNPHADFDDVMSKLAANWSVEELLVNPEWTARSPYRPPMSPIPPGDRYMIDELRALARQAWEEMPWPDPPKVDLGRLAADYERTTGCHLAFSREYEAYPDGGFWSVMVSIDGAVSGGVGEELSGDPEGDLVRLADRLQSEHLGEDFEGDWPRCPHHRNIVMLPNSEGGIATWTCQADPAHQVRIGNLGLDEI